MENQTIKSSAINYGLYLGIILALCTIIPYAIDLNLFTEFWLLIVILLSIIISGILSIRKVKQLFGGYISFKEAFTSYFITVAIGLLISSLTYFLIFSIIDTEAANQLTEIRIENQAEMMQKFGAPEDSIAEAIEKMESDDQFSIGNQILGYCIFLIGMSVIGLIVAAIMKKTNPDTN